MWNNLIVIFLAQEYCSCKAVLHCFTGNIDEAKEAQKRGWMISFSGVVTFKKSQALRQVAKEMPLDKLLIETDCPYLAPEGLRGKINEPAYLVSTAREMARIKNISLEELALATTKNACDFFNF